MPRFYSTCVYRRNAFSPSCTNRFAAAVLVSLMLLITHDAFSQFEPKMAGKKKKDCTCVDARTLGGTQRASYDRKRCRRNYNLAFARQTLIYSPLSFVSGPFMELGVPKDHYVLSADVQPQFLIGGRWMPFPIHVTPRYMVRIFHNSPVHWGDSSLAVRTPSFMPGASIFVPLHRLKANLCSELESPYLDYVSVSCFHHSNGQDGNEFTGYGKKLNHYNGNFSTNYIEPAYNFRYRAPNPPRRVDFCNGTGSAFHEWYGRLGLETHVWTADSLKRTYGDVRLNGRLGLLFVRGYEDVLVFDDNRCAKLDDPYHRETWRFVLNGSFIASEREGRFDHVRRRVNVDVSAYRRINGSPNTAVFLTAGYYGSDPYNIYYDDWYFFARAGLSMGFFLNPVTTEPEYHTL